MTIIKHYPQIRGVKKGDLDQLFAMLIDLVKHEGLYDRFKITRERLENELFGLNADWNCLIATDDTEHLIGFCLYTIANINRAFHTQPMIQVDDLYVSPPYRKAGVAQGLLRELAIVAKAKNIGRFNIFCVRDNEMGQNFYQKMGATKLDFIDVFDIKVEELLR